MRIGQLNTELAVQAHALARDQPGEVRRLRRLYIGLQIMTLMAVGLVGLGGIAGLVGTAEGGGKRPRPRRGRASARPSASSRSA